FFSPYSIRTAFGMLYEGAQGNTAKELENIFAFETDEKKRLSSVHNELKNYNSMNDGYGIQVANSFWANRDRVIKPAYKSILKDYYFAQLETINVKNSQESADRINLWVNDKTKGRIPSIITPDDIVEETLAVLVNAIYFKAKWLQPFESENTEKRDFYISKNNKIEVDMMLNDSENDFGYLENDKVQVLKMRYQNVENMPSMSMIAVLPKENNIADAENYIYSNTIADIQKSFEFPEVIVYFPKFELRWEMGMLEIIENMGLNNVKPDYSKICDLELEISKVIHKAFIKIDEKETEAAAVTVIDIETSAADYEPPKLFKADHPFMYLIVDEDTNQILFMGKMLNPDGCGCN
ncbi:MAG: serpin family protein, partial [Endomicrobia bacterium]|nr:serpin family protein [Endomicrobiia bacterium]